MVRLAASHAPPTCTRLQTSHKYPSSSGHAATRRLTSSRLLTAISCDFCEAPGHCNAYSRCEKLDRVHFGGHFQRTREFAWISSKTGVYKSLANVALLIGSG